MIDTVPIPNLSIVLPGMCDVKCTFCTWRNGATSGVKAHDKYLERIDYILNTLPDQFISISLTGGEPLLSPYLWPVLDLIDKNRWERVGLTTNATNLAPSILDRLSEKLNFINISRHHYDDSINEKIFDSAIVPKTDQLAKINQYAYNVGIPVSYNTVLTKHFPAKKSEIEKMVKFAFQTNAQRVNFRKIQGPKTTTAPSSHEAMYLNDPTYVNYPCPVCRTADTRVGNMTVSWKAAVLEPSIHLGYWFEGVVHPSGVLSGDWDGTMPGEPEDLKVIDTVYEDEELVITRSELSQIVSEILSEQSNGSTPTAQKYGSRDTSGKCGSGGCGP